MQRLSFDIIAGSDAAIDAADLARKILQARGLQVTRGTIWARGHRPVPDNARKKFRQFDLLVLDDIDADALDGIADLWRRVGLTAGTDPKRPWQVCRAPHSGGIPRFHEEMQRGRDEERCNGFTNWDTWNVAAAIDNAGEETTQRYFAIAAECRDAYEYPVQEFSMVLQEDIERGRIKGVSFDPQTRAGIDLAKLDYHELYNRYANPEA